jgi:selenocysteine lyase/cysteine desulfurase
MYPKTILNFPDDVSGLPRRSFLKKFAGAAAATASLPLLGCADAERRGESFDAIAARTDPTDPGDEAYWNEVKRQFPVRDGLIMLNAANLCPSPTRVQHRVFELTRDVDADASFTNRAKFGEQREEARTAVAAYVGASIDEIAMVRNTSEANNTVVGGLQLTRGDEVVIWDQNHPTANVAWDVRAQRYGFTVKRVSTPENPGSPEELITAFTDAFTPNTRVLAFSHVSNVSGVRINAEELCPMARERGILTLVDGAQTFGTYDLALSEMGCDFYTASSHKWFCGPKEVGILYVRRERIGDLWPLSVGVGWGDGIQDNARKFETLGQRDDSRISAMADAVEFQNQIGTLRVITRARQLADAVKQGVQRKQAGAKIVTPIPHEMSWGVVVFHVPGLDPGDALNALYDQDVGCAIMGDNVRYSPHFYNTLDDIDRATDAVANLV